VPAIVAHFELRGQRWAATMCYAPRTQGNERVSRTHASSWQVAECFRADPDRRMFALNVLSLTGKTDPVVGCLALPGESSRTL